jgi:hypothetical protein
MYGIPLFFYGAFEMPFAADNIVPLSPWFSAQPPISFSISCYYRQTTTAKFAWSLTSSQFCGTPPPFWKC